MIKMIKKAILMVLLLSLIAVGCQKQAVPSATEGIKDTASIESGISDINSVNEEINAQELDSIESDLDKINW